MLMQVLQFHLELMLKLEVVELTQRNTFEP